MSPIIERNKYSQLYGRTIVVTDNFDSSSGWLWGRWILFVIFVICIIAVGLGTARINRRRRAMGEAPIRGTAWMTPPSYRQSQRQYNGPEGSEDYVPQYTATANDQDLGYYDEHGEFHLNAKAEAQAPPTLTRETVSDSSESLERPRAAVTRDSHSEDFDQEFRRYVPPPPPSEPTAQPNMPGGFQDHSADGERSEIQVGNSDNVALQEISPPEKVKSPRGL